MHRHYHRSHTFATTAHLAHRYPDIRLFTVGQKTSSPTPLQDLATIEQPWSLASNVSVSDGSAFNYFSAVCWFFGKTVCVRACGGAQQQQQQQQHLLLLPMATNAHAHARTHARTHTHTHAH